MKFLLLGAGGCIRSSDILNFFFKKIQSFCGFLFNLLWTYTQHWKRQNKSLEQIVSVNVSLS